MEIRQKRGDAAVATKTFRGRGDRPRGHSSETGRGDGRGHDVDIPRADIDGSRLRRRYFIQDYEPNFKRLNKAQKQRALESYTLYPHMLAMAKTSWLRQTVFKHHGTKVRAVRGTLDLGKFEAARRRRPRRTPSKTIVAAMVRPATPRRNPAGTLRVLEGLRIARPSVDVRTFGSTPDALDELLEAEDLLNTTKARHRAAHLGPLDQDGIAKLFARSDVFLDLSLFQAFGRAGLEAMVPTGADD